MMQRRDLLWALASLTVGTGSQAAALGVTPRALRFPADFGAHTDTRIEWWYLTGSLAPAGADVAAPAYGFQLTFFRVRTAVDAAHPSRFAARQLLMAHAALTDLPARTLRHDQALARSGFGLAEAGEADTDVRLHGWRLLRRPEAGYRAELRSERANFALALDLKPSQPVLLQGQGGYSRKGPEPGAASHYYSEPQLQLAGELTLDGRRLPVQGRAWLDHEWSNQLLGSGPDSAIGWDWTGVNLLDGGALTLFRLRRADGSVHWAGGSYRAAGQREARDFAPAEVSLRPGRVWKSARTGASYPVSWQLHTPMASFELRALLDDQELDARGSTGTVYWEGLSELLDDKGRRVGLGYLEMTGYAGPLRLG